MGVEINVVILVLIIGLIILLAVIGAFVYAIVKKDARVLGFAGSFILANILRNTFLSLIWSNRIVGFLLWIVIFFVADSLIQGALPSSWRRSGDTEVK